MKTVHPFKRALLLALSCLGAANAFSQSGPPPLPTPGLALNLYRFDSTNWPDIRGHLPVSSGNIACVPSWDANALWLGTNSPAWLQYRVIEADGRTNLNCSAGSLSVWLLTDWTSASLGGNGPGDWGRIIDVGRWTTNAETGWLSLYFSPDGNTVTLSGQSNGLGADYVSASLALDNSGWHQLCATWSPTNSALYLDGAPLETNGAGVDYYPGSEALTNGFFVGSDSGTGLEQVRGTLEDLGLWNYPLRADTIAALYSNALPQVWPLSSLTSRGLSSDFSDPPFPFPPGGGDGSPDGGGTPFTFPTNGLWLEILSPGTNQYNPNDTNSVAVLLHGTISDVTYTLFSTTNLPAATTGTLWTAWSVEQNLIGAPDTNVTPTTVYMPGRTNLFLRALAATLDDDGDGLPSWWEMRYGLNPTNADTGNAGVPDGYKMDSAGDGWNNLQKYQMGLPPNVWATPPAPTGLNVVMGSNGLSATLSWNPALGNVIGYTILRNNGYLDGFTVLTNLSASQTNFVDDALPTSWYTGGGTLGD